MRKQTIIREDLIKRRLEKSEFLVKSQIIYIRKNIKPGYNDMDDNHRVEILMYFGYPYELACDFVNSTRTELYFYDQYEDDQHNEEEAA